MLYVAATTYTAARRGTHVTSKEVCVVTSKECMCCRVWLIYLFKQTDSYMYFKILSTNLNAFFFGGGEGGPSYILNFPISSFFFSVFVCVCLVFFQCLFCCCCCCFCVVHGNYLVLAVTATQQTKETKQNKNVNNHSIGFSRSTSTAIVWISCVKGVSLGWKTGKIWWRLEYE